MKAPYDNSFGTWEVTTEGDVEGRTTTNLGTFTGHIDDIALHLADKCYYCLKFTPVTPVKEFTPKKGYVDIQLGYDSGTWSIPINERVAAFYELLIQRPVHVAPSNIYGCVRIVSLEPVDTKKAKALAKLTEEEKEILGLK